ncbi:chaplin family protein [Actinomadura darangshiensis]|nr:chaplin family protein [Actinomadura darangshiensis]
MRMWAKNTARAALVAAGALAAGAAFGSTTGANAATMYGGGWDGGHDKVNMQSSNNFGLLNGNQVYAPISIPIDVCGNAIAIAGLSRAQCKGGASVSAERSGGSAMDAGYREGGAWGGSGGGWGGGGHKVDMQTAGNFGIGNGNQVYAPISLPIDVCGNAVAVLGAAQAQCKGGASVKRAGDPDVKMQSTGNFGLLNGNQVYIPIKAPISVCGNAVAVLGLAEAQCKGGATVGGGDEEMPPTLRTPPKKKVYKPSKHRPAAKHKKLPSTLRADGSRAAGPNYRSADGLPAVQDFVNSLKRTAKVPGVDVTPGQIGPQSPMQDQPVTIGSPVLS